MRRRLDLELGAILPPWAHRTLTLQPGKMPRRGSLRVSRPQGI